jgi:hypothetical protein
MGKYQIMENREYLGVLTKSFTSQDLGKPKISWHVDEIVIVKEIYGISNFQIIKLKNRLLNMVVIRSAFIYYRPSWVKLR